MCAIGANAFDTLNRHNMMASVAVALEADIGLFERLMMMSVFC